MATVKTQRPMDPKNPLDRWRNNVDRAIFKESDEFVDDALALLRDSSMVEEFKNNVASVGAKANEIDASFDRVTRDFGDLVDKYGKDFPGIGTYFADWKKYNERWVNALGDSRNVASSHASILKRFRDVFLQMALKIETKQQLEDTQYELKAFTEEYHPTGQQLSLVFTELKRDIEHFVRRLNDFVVQMGSQLSDQAQNLEIQIRNLVGQVAALDEQIKHAKIALAIAGGLLNIIGLITAGSVLAAFQSQRNGKYDELRARQGELAEVNRKQTLLPHLQSQIDGLRPDIDLICANLVLFGEIWLQVQSLSKQLLDQMNGGLAAATNYRFQLEMELVQKTCYPLVDGLESYATQIRPRSVN